jgi:anhydro-N-acetylmuramic acid kinase
MALYIGLMSGTSLDGVDAVLAELDDEPGPIRTLAHLHLPMPPAMRAELLALNQRGGKDELHRSALACNGLARLYAEATHALLQSTGTAAGSIRALGAHGQTVRHQPGAHDGTGYTIQLINGALLAELTGIDTACDFRSRDVAAGGQGAPLVPAFHAAVFARADEPVAVVNIGGIANISLLDAGGAGARGFDCGPGNALMDLWCQRHRGDLFDANGAWASTGQVDETLLQALMSEPWLALPPPKSTGRDLFDAAWLQSRLDARSSVLEPRDTMATLAEFTAHCISSHLRCHAPQTTTLLVCGGGAFNAHLLERLRASNPGVTLSTTVTRGVAPDQVEALAFAWLAHTLLQGRPGNLPQVTGARGPRLLGAVYRA